MEPNQNLPQAESESATLPGDDARILPRILPMDPRGLAALEGNRNHGEDGGEGVADGAFPVDDFGGEDVHGEIPAVYSEA